MKPYIMCYMGQCSLYYGNQPDYHIVIALCLKNVLMGKSSHYETNVRVWDFRFQALFLCQN